MNKNTEDLLMKMQEFYDLNGSYVPLQPNKIHLDEDEQTLIKDNPQLFFMASRSRVILHIWICKGLREIFELYEYSDVDLPNEAYSLLRDKFKTKAFNKMSFMEIYSINDSNLLSYEDFVKIEKKFIQAYNKEVSETHKLSMITHINMKPKTKTVSYARELESLLENTRSKKIIYLRARGKTLDEIGEDLAVTRERARQIELKPRIGIERWLLTRGTEIAKDLSRKGLISNKKAEKEFGKENWEIVKYVVSNSKLEDLNWKYFSLLDFIYINNNNIEPLIKDLKKDFSFAAENHNNIIEKFTEYLVSHSFEFWTNDFTEKYFESLGINPKTEITTGRVTIGSAIKYAAKKSFPNGVKLTNADDMKKLADEVNKIFKLGVVPGRAFSTRVQEILIMRDKSTYTDSSYVNVSDNLLVKIENYINSMDTQQVPYEVIFKKFEKELASENIDNHFFLHGILRYYAENGKMDIKCFRYYVTKSHNEFFESKEYFKILYSYLKDKKKPVSLDQLRKDFPSWNPLYFNYAMHYYPVIVRWTKNELFNLDSLDLTQQDRDSVINAVTKNIENKLGYTNSYILFSYIKKNNPEFIRKFNIHTEGEMYHIIQYICNDIFFCRRPHILKKWDSDHFTTQDLIRLVIKDNKLINKQDIVRKVEVLYGSKNSSIRLAVQKEMENYIKINSEEYLLKSELKISHNTLEKIEAALTPYLLKNEVILPNKIKDFSKFPKIGYEWNPWILIEILRECDTNYKIVGKRNLPSQNVLSVIVKKNSKLNSRDDVFRWLLSNVFDKEINIANVFNYAKTVGIFHSNLTSDDIKDFC